MSTGSPKFCAACGHALQPGAKFCPDCGEKLTPAQVAEQAKIEEKKAEAATAEPAPAAPTKAEPKKAAPAPSSDGDHDDHLPPPDHDDDLDELHPHKLHKGPSTPVIAGGIALVVMLGAVLFLTSNPERLAAFQCRVLGQADKCETEAMKLAKLKKQQNEEEQQLMVSAAAQFDLGFDPKESWVTIVQKRYEEPRDDFVKRVRDNGPDNRKLVETRFGDYVVSKAKGEQGQIKGAIAFVTAEEWTAKHSSPDTQPALIPEPPPPPPKPGDPPPPPPPPVPVPPKGPISWWPKKNQEITLPMAVQNLPMLEKEQADGSGKRLTAEAIAELQKKIEEAASINAAPKKEGEEVKKDDPVKDIKTVAVSTWIYEVHLWAPGYFQRDIVFYDDPLPPDLDKKKLEADKWTVRKFKKTPDGKLVIDNASFDLLPEPRTLQGRYIRVLKEIHCLKQSKEYQGKSAQGQKDDEELLWEQAAFTKEKKEIAMKNDGDPQFEAERQKMLKEAKCEKAPQ
ncbi:MAG: zinc ribbon domain-containing protein [Deltaproteobacteria bacterium]|nr:zinc ribbon domain-containing protein [Deltaproteobacteria bacterium]